MRSSAAYAVGHLLQGGPPRSEAIHALKLALEDTDINVRFSTVNALGIVGPSAFEAVDALARLIEDRELLVRLAAIKALTEIARCSSLSESVVTVMRRGMKSTDVLVRSSTAEALGRLGLSSPTVITALEAATEDPDEVVSRATLMASGELVGSKVVVVDLDGLAGFPQRLRYNISAERAVDEEDYRFKRLRARARSGWPLRSRCASGHSPPLTRLSTLRLCNVPLQPPWELPFRL